MAIWMMSWSKLVPPVFGKCSMRRCFASIGEAAAACGLKNAAPAALCGHQSVMSCFHDER